MSTARPSTLAWFSSRLHLGRLLAVLADVGWIEAELQGRESQCPTLAEALKRRLASESPWPRVLAAGLGILIALELGTGGLLALYYSPTPATAHESVSVIQTDLEFGWLIHQCHFWGAQLLILLLLVAVLRSVALGLYHAPHELEWLVALGLLAVAVLADLSGRLLLWTHDSYWLGVRLVEALAAIPWLGPLALAVLGGEGTFLSSLTLLRGYGAHVVVLPLTLLGLVLLYASGVRRLASDEPSGGTDVDLPAVFKRSLTEAAMVLVVALTALSTLAVLRPQPFAPAADPLVTPPVLELPWHLLAPAGFLRLASAFLTPAGALILIVGLTSVLALLPLLHRRAAGRRRRLLVVATAAVVWLVLTLFALGGGR